MRCERATCARGDEGGIFGWSVNPHSVGFIKSISIKDKFAIKKKHMIQDESKTSSKNEKTTSGHKTNIATTERSNMGEWQVRR
jgi:hypothetical protein